VTALSAAITLFLLMDPVGNSPVFLATLRRLTPARRRRAILRELLFALAVLVVFLVFGQALLSALDIDQAALAVAGGVVLFTVAMRLIFPGRAGSGAEVEDDIADPWFVPLAVPMVAGPSAMAYVMLLSTRYPEAIWTWLGVVCAVWVVSAAILFTASALQRFLKPGGLRALERLVGMILIVIAVQMLMDGIGLALVGYGLADG
jgi:multiple antibiotic resistance protein